MSGLLFIPFQFHEKDNKGKGKTGTKIDGVIL